MPLTEKGTEIKKNMVSEYGSKKKGEQVFYASANAGKITGVDRRRFRDALRRGLSLDAAFGYAAAEEATRAGQGNPLDSRLVKQCIRDSVGEGGSTHDVLKRAVDRRIAFQGSRDNIVEGVGEAAKHIGNAGATVAKGAGQLAESATQSVEGARAMRHPQGQDAAVRDHTPMPHECSPENCYPGCGHLCMQGRGVLEKLLARKGLVRDASCPPGEGEVGTPSYAWKSENNTTAAADRRRKVRDELFAAQPGGKTARLLLGDRGKTDDFMVADDTSDLPSQGRMDGNQPEVGSSDLPSQGRMDDKKTVSDRRATLDALINKIKGRKLGNKRHPMVRDSV